MPDTFGNPETWGKILIVGAHPDDEVLALGGHFGAVHPRIFHMTNGASAPHVNARQLADARSEEVRRVLELAGIPSHHYFTSAVPDQCAVDCLPKLYRDLLRMVEREQPDCLLTHPYEGGHPDHDAASLVCNLVSQTAGGLPVREFPSYHNATPFSAQATWRTSVFMEPAGHVTSIALSKHRQERKKCLLALFATQAEVLERFPTDYERFRWAPKYRYSEPPHKGTLLYESFDWNIRFESWRDRCARGTDEISRSMGRQLACSRNLG